MTKDFSEAVRDNMAKKTDFSKLTEEREKRLGNEKPKGPTFDQQWLRLGSQEEDSGIIRISEIAAVTSDPHRGVALTMKSGETLVAPDAIYSDVKLAMMAAEVGAVRR